MRKILKRIKNNKGYISLETIIVSGIVILAGIVAIVAFQNKAKDLTNDSMNHISEAQTSYSQALGGNVKK